MAVLIVETPCCRKKVRQIIADNFDSTFLAACSKCGAKYEANVKSEWGKNGAGDHWINWTRIVTSIKMDGILGNLGEHPTLTSLRVTPDQEAP